MSSVPQKRCSKCGEAKSCTEFGKDKHRPDGLNHRCKACIRSWHQDNRERVNQAARNRNAVNRDAYLEYHRNYHAANRERRLEQNRTYYQEHADQLREYAREYRAANLEERQGYERQWRRDNLDAVRAQGQVKRARKRDAVCGCVTVEHTAFLYAQTCAYCNAAPATDIDHIMPLARGGLHCLSNLAPACGPCNGAKHAKIIDNPPTPMFACAREAC